MDLSVLLIVLLTSYIGECGVIDSFAVTSGDIPQQGMSFSVTCNISGNLSARNVLITKKNASSDACNCYLPTCIVKVQNASCIFDASLKTITFTFERAQRSDEGIWICSTDTESGLQSKKEIFVIIYTLPDSISFEGLFTESQERWQNSLKMTCKTDSCTYKDPVFTWHYFKSGGETVEFSSSSAEGSSLTRGCADSEMIYSSTLVIPKYTTAEDNKELTTRFLCKMSFPGISFTKTTQKTPNVSFAVEVTTVTLKQGNSLLNQSLIVTAGTAVNLTCEPGNNRPPPTITWWVNDDKKQDSKSIDYRLVATNDDHDRYIFCKAYNLQTESEAVVSTKPKLYVRVQVSSVTLQLGSSLLNQYLTVTAGSPVTLTCEPGESRPAPSIDWYIGKSLKQSLVKTTYDIDAGNSDHGKHVYCKAYNLQNSTYGISSSKPMLYVRVEAMTPTIVNETDETIQLLENNSYTLQCRSTATRPAAIMNWQLNSNNLTQSDSETVTGNDGLVFVLSKVSVVVTRQSHNSQIVCYSYITNQKEKKETRKTVIVYWPPATPRVNPVGNLFPWVEGQRGELSCNSSNLGHPDSSVRWIEDDGISITNAFVIGNLSYTDNNKEVRCHLTNTFTELKEEVVESGAITLNVHFSPKFFRTQTVFAGKPNRNITIPVYFYVNPTVTTVRVIMSESTLILMNGTMFQDQKYILSIGDIELDQTISENKLTKGNRLNLTILNLQENDFTQYEIRISNMRGENGIPVSITSESEPVTPTNFRLLEQKGHALIFYWQKGFNGGHRQTFWIQMTIAEQNNWLNETVINETDENNRLKNGSFIANVTGLSPGTYSVRLIAVNKIGKADPVLLNPSIIIQATEDETETGNDTQDNTGLVVLSVCLGALLVISLLTIGVLASKIFLLRKGRMVQGRYVFSAI